MNKFPGESYDAWIRRETSEYYDVPDPCEICGGDKKAYRENEIDAERYRAIRKYYSDPERNIFSETATLFLGPLMLYQSGNFDEMVDEQFDVEY
jgi:hypothetical protein